MIKLNHFDESAEQLPASSIPIGSEATRSDPPTSRVSTAGKSLSSCEARIECLMCGVSLDFRQVVVRDKRSSSWPMSPRAPNATSCKRWLMRRQNNSTYPTRSSLSRIFNIKHTFARFRHKSIFEPMAYSKSRSTSSRSLSPFAETSHESGTRALTSRRYPFEELEKGRKHGIILILNKAHIQTSQPFCLLHKFTHRRSRQSEKAQPLVSPPLTDTLPHELGAHWGAKGNGQHRKSGGYRNMTGQSRSIKTAARRKDGVRLWRWGRKPASALWASITKCGVRPMGMGGGLHCLSEYDNCRNG
jgi:hypothetical protein